MEQQSSRLFSLPVLLASVWIFVVTCPRATHGHGRLIDPPARNSMWRFGFDNPVNYNDNELYCGGRMVQWLKNGGKCGVCGDSYHGDRPHEAGGKYAKGIIVKTYEEGSEMDITVHLTANHLGFFEFRLCPHDDPKTRVKQACLDKHLLERPDGLGTRFSVPKGKYNAMFNYTLKLPRGLTCNQCVIQWKYRTGNTWDKENDSGRFCLGCGPQEEFYNCADISIEPRRAAVIEYPTSQPDPPRFLPTINLPTVATAKQAHPNYTKSPLKSTAKHRVPVRRPTPPHLPHIPPPPRLPHSKTRPVNKQRQPKEQMTSIFTTAKPRTKKPTTTKSTTKPTVPRKTTKVIPRRTWRPRTTRTTRTTTRKFISTKSTTEKAVPTTTLTTTTKATTTQQIPKSTTTRRTHGPTRRKPIQTTTVPPQRKTTGYYKIVPRKTWRPPRPREEIRATNSPTTSPEKPRKKPRTSKNPFEYLKTRRTPKSPFSKPTTKKYKYWKPVKTKYPLLKDDLELDDTKEFDTQKPATIVPRTKRPRATTKSTTKTTQKVTTATTRRTKSTQSSVSTRTSTMVSPTTTEPTTPITTKPTTTSSTARTTKVFPRRTRPTTVVWTEARTVKSDKTRKWVKWWTNKPETTTTSSVATTTPVTKTTTTTERSRTSPSLWWPPIWLPWTPWTHKTQAPTTTYVSTTQQPPTTTTTTEQTRLPVYSTPWMKEGNPLDNVFGKIGSSENLPWYIAGDFTWKTSSPTEQNNRVLEEVSKISDKSSTAHVHDSTTKLPCLISTSPKPQQRDNLVKSPFQPPRQGRRWTRPPSFRHKTPPVWFRTAIPPVAQPVQPPPPSHHLWVKKNVRTCRAIIPLSVGMNDWCFVNCNSGFCPTKFCYCENKHKHPRYRHWTKKPPLWWQESLNPRTNPTTPTKRPRFVNRKRVEASRRDRLHDRERALQNIKQNMYRCKGIGKYSDRPKFDDWCQTNCRSVLCPLLICGCTWR